MKSNMVMWSDERSAGVFHPSTQARLSKVWPSSQPRQELGRSGCRPVISLARPTGGLRIERARWERLEGNPKRSPLAHGVGRVSDHDKRQEQISPEVRA